MDGMESADNVIRAILLLLALKRISMTPMSLISLLITFSAMLSFAFFCWRYIIAREKSSIFASSADKADMHAAWASLSILMLWVGVTCKVAQRKWFQHTNSACLGFVCALVAMHFLQESGARIFFRVKQMHLTFPEYVLTMLGSAFSHADWRHLSCNTLSLLLVQLNGMSSSKFWWWDSPVVFLFLLLGGAIAGDACNIGLAILYEQQTQAKTNALAEDMFSSVACQSSFCQSIPGSSIWNSMAGFGANMVAELRTSGARNVLSEHSNAQRIGSSAGLFAVMAGHAVHASAEHLAGGARAQRGTAAETWQAASHLLPIALYLADEFYACPLSIDAAMAASGGGEMGVHVDHVAHLAGGLFGLLFAVIAHSIAAAALRPRRPEALFAVRRPPRHEDPPPFLHKPPSLRSEAPLPSQNEGHDTGGARLDPGRQAAAEDADAVEPVVVARRRSRTEALPSTARDSPAAAAGAAAMARLTKNSRGRRAELLRANVPR